MRIAGIIISLSCLLLGSCQQNITLQLPKYNPQVCVYCILEAGAEPMMFLNLSQSYYNYGDTAGGVRVIKNATVTITDQTENRVDKLFLDSNYLPASPELVWFYTINKPYKTGHHYVANISYNGQIITAEATIPQAIKKIDTVTYERYFNPSSGWWNYTFHYFFHDIPGEPDYYTAISPNAVSFNNFYSNFISDAGQDGQQLEITTTNPTLGPPPLSLGAQVISVTEGMAKYEADVWTQHQSGGPLSEPVAIESNINGGLGVFGALTSSPAYLIKIIK